MRLGGAYGQRGRTHDWEIAHRQPPAPRNVQEYELVLGLAGEAASVLGLGGREGDYLEGGLLLGLR